MTPFPLSGAADILGARIRGDLPFGRLIHSISTDTRLEAAESLFFALRGENHDGHEYAAQAFERGAIAAVVEREITTPGPVLIVPNALTALGDLAGWYRARFDIPVVGVTGSVGKTSCKEMIACALRYRLRVQATPGNLNNEIGLPMTLFGIDSGTQAAVLEMGMRGPGQIARLAGIAQPSIGVITKIGMSHVELLGSREAIARAKAELLETIPQDGLCVIPHDDDFAAILASRCRGRIVTFGRGEQADFRVDDLELNSDGGPHFTVNGQPFAIRAIGAHHALNAAAACAVASDLGVPLAEVAQALESFRSPAMRMHRCETAAGITLLDDSYNAAPDSMLSALVTLEAAAGGRRKVAVLGDMKELGTASEDAHRLVGRAGAKRGVDLLITVGELAASISESAGIPDSIHYATTAEAAEAVRDLIRPGDVVLVKGSRAMAMEQIVQAIAGEPGVEASH